MSNEVSIFKNRDVAVAGKKSPSALTQTLIKAGSKLKRISPRNGMFVRVVNGDVAGKLKEGQPRLKKIQLRLNLR